MDLGVTHFDSALAEPVAGVSDNNALTQLVAREEVRSARTLASGFISVRFKVPMRYEDLSAFKAAVSGFAVVRENYRKELHAV